ncbi:hypothetical protein NDU88_006805 [Pleurodeles waltl]|uniref:Reverse transcriptase zinc-binding domain-containing protein n=1 Tax=Pleurodeles waltl TaxID=8319 RepID=A0AAV7QJU5_PLEWA|nr:hypothetical protein NDU88_006805 [Pleurodeles waltl]
MQLDTPMKKEVARWYWLMMDIVDGEFTLPEEIWRECLPEPQLKDLWQVSTTLLYNTVTPAALRQDNVVRCKKCGSASADDLHMFIDFPILRKFWQEVGDAIKEILRTSPKETATPRTERDRGGTLDSHATLLVVHGTGTNWLSGGEDVLQGVGGQRDGPRWDEEPEARQQQ